MTLHFSFYWCARHSTNLNDEFTVLNIILIFLPIVVLAPKVCYLIEDQNT